MSTSIYSQKSVINQVFIYERERERERESYKEKEMMCRCECNYLRNSEVVALIPLEKIMSPAPC